MVCISRHHCSYLVAIDGSPFLLPVPAAEGNTLTIVLIDGMSSSIFNDELRLGKLPVLSQLIKKSLYVENGISAFPTMTGYGFYPFITGIDASESGTYGLRWFDKERNKGQLRNYVGRTNVQMNHDLHPEPKTFLNLREQIIQPQ